MSYSHSFSQDFYGSPEFAKKQKRPKTVCNALRSISDEEWLKMAKHCFPNNPNPEMIDVDDVLELIIKTDTVTNITVPSIVWIDEDGEFTIAVY